MKESKLIVLRGPSGSGKSTTSVKLREVSSNPTALVEQDYIRRYLLGDQKANKSVCADLIKHIILDSLEGGYDVIVDPFDCPGIFNGTPPPHPHPLTTHRLRDTV